MCGDQKRKGLPVPAGSPGDIVKAPTVTEASEKFSTRRSVVPYIGGPIWRRRRGLLTWRDMAGDLAAYRQGVRHG